MNFFYKLYPLPHPTLSQMGEGEFFFNLKFFNLLTPHPLPLDQGGEGICCLQVLLGAENPA
jgi:hypothetical protein